MSGELLDSFPIEKQMGILYFCTKSEGIGGRIRVYPKDFKVEEILPDGRIIKLDDQDFSLGKDQPGLFTEFILIKRNIESHKAQLKIAEALGLKLNDINVAGTKDKLAFTAQRATIWRVPPERLLELKIGGIEIRSPRTAIYKTFLGDLKGNNFTIKIRRITKNQSTIQEIIEKIRREIREFGGIANFFGHQRFGTKRPVSHAIGKHLLLGDFEAAIMTYLTKIYDDESERTKIARKTFLETNDPEETLKVFPKKMIFERRILEYLKKYPSDFQGTLSEIPRNLKKMFIHSYQSYLWNLSLSERMHRYGNLHPQSSDLIENGEIVLPLIGYKTKFTDNEWFNYLEELLESEGITKKDFTAPAIPGIKFAGSMRKITITPNNLSISMSENSNGEAIVTMQFSLQSGSYATIVLRELMKTSPTYF